MKHSYQITFFTVLCVAILTQPFTTLQAQAQKTNTLFPAWTSIFNGKNLVGWKTIGNEQWVVKEGVIYGSGVTQKYGYLATEKTYTDFHLSLRFKCDAAGNSGVYLHTHFDGEDTTKVITGRQIEIDPTIGNHTGGIYSATKGWVAWPAPNLEIVLRPYAWNELLIMVEGNRHRSYLNGILMVDFTYPTPNSSDGVIALQLHSGGKGRMRFKDIFISYHRCKSSNLL